MKSKHGLTTADGFPESEILKLEKLPTLDERIIWMANNRENLKELDPEWDERLNQIEREANPIYVANYIQEYAKHMQQRIDELPGIDRPIKRASEINMKIKLIDEILRPEGYSTAIEMAAVESVRAELTEWRGVLSGMLAGKNKAKNNIHTVGTIALFHVYSGKKITPTNKDSIAKKDYGLISGTRLYRDYEKYGNKKKRTELDTTCKRSAGTHLKRFVNVLPMLEKAFPVGYRSAAADLITVQKTYDTYF